MQKLPSLPSLPDLGDVVPSIRAKDVRNNATVEEYPARSEMRGPTKFSNWLIPKKVMMGSYPGSKKTPKEHRRIIKSLVSVGITTFVCLQDEVVPEKERGIDTPYFTPYEQTAREEAIELGINYDLSFLNFGIEDGKIAEDEKLLEFLKILEKRILENNEVLYIHCWGGHGRTGTISSCLLGKLYNISSAKALRYVQIVHDCREETRGIMCPETNIQIGQVKRILYGNNEQGEQGEKNQEVEEEIDECEAENRISIAVKAKESGNKKYRVGEWESAANLYSEGLESAPIVKTSREIRSILYANRGACFLHLNRTEEAVADCTAALKLDSCYIKAQIRRAQANEALEKYELALNDIESVLKVDSGNSMALSMQPRVKTLLEKQREKQTQEMMGSLKKIGSQFLGRFGIDLDSFKATKDPSTGSYNISYQPK